MPPVTQKKYLESLLQQINLGGIFSSVQWDVATGEKLTNDRERNHAQEDVDSYEVQNKNKFREDGLFYFFV